MSELVSTNLVSTGWLADHLNDVRVVDASWYMPDDRRDPAREFEQAHIPGAVFFDIDGIADKSSGLPHVLPSMGGTLHAIQKWLLHNTVGMLHLP